MLRVLPDPARAIVAVAAFLGLRRGEIRGLEWPDYSGEEIRVMRSVWESITNEPKTRKSKASVPVISPLQRLLDQFQIEPWECRKWADVWYDEKDTLEFE